MDAAVDLRCRRAASVLASLMFPRLQINRVLAPPACQIAKKGTVEAHNPGWTESRQSRPRRLTLHGVAKLQSWMQTTARAFNDRTRGAGPQRRLSRLTVSLVA